MRVVILGGGVVGVTSAWTLATAGCDVTLIERQPALAQETSFANGGQISVSHAEPWANPDALGRIVRWLGREDAPLLWRWRADAAQWRWGIGFLRECSGTRTRANIRTLIALGLHSRQRLGELRAELALDYHQQLRGILHIYTNAAEYRHALDQAELMREFGCDRRPASADLCREIEPALAGVGSLAGGTYTAQDESGDARVFTEQLGRHAAQAGVRVRCGTSARRLLIADGRITGVEIEDADGIQALAADQVVVALGSYTAPFLRTYGLRATIYPAKGYSATFTLQTGMRAPQVSLTDDAHKLVFSRLGDTLRVAGTAEFSGDDLNLNPARCEAIRRRTVEFFPDLATVEPHYWCGLRPATPGNVPLIGATRLPGLWLNSGHGTLGWTLACGSAHLLADLLCGRAPAVDPQPYAPTRPWA